jgi:L-threonylcarbamoyladenylate synthase
MEIITLDRDTDSIITQAAVVLKNGGLVIFPSDTVYGALVDATNERAVQKLINFKSRPPGKAISVFVDSWSMLEKQVLINQDQKESLKQFLPGAFTVILPSKHRLSKTLESEKGSLGIRYIDYLPINKLVNKYGKPLTATSANISGNSPHYSVNSLLNELPKNKSQLIDLIVDGGQLPRNRPSTIIDLTQPQIKILRHGGIAFNQNNFFVTVSPEQTKKIARDVFNQRTKERKPLVFVIEGEMGVGKTVFVKGIGEKLGIENIISPTFVVCYEYPISYNGFDTLIHFDLYNIEDEEEYLHLGIENYLKPGKVLCFEWGEKIGKLYERMKNEAKVILIRMEYIDEKKRRIGLTTIN